MATTVRRAMFCLCRTLNSTAVPNNRASNAVASLRSKILNFISYRFGPATTLLISRPLISPPSYRSHLDSVSCFSSDTQSSDIDLSNEENKKRVFNRLLYRSRQRGFLELDLVLGSWVEQHISSMDETRIKALVNVLDLRYSRGGYSRVPFNEYGSENIALPKKLGLRHYAYNYTHQMENPDLWKWLTGQERPPEAVNNNPVFCAVHDKVMNNLNNHSAPETRALPGTPWVRGWDDMNKGRDSPISGNQ